MEFIEKGKYLSINIPKENSQLVIKSFLVPINTTKYIHIYDIYIQLFFTYETGKVVKKLFKKNSLAIYQNIKYNHSVTQ